jgi:hypothetical protein
MTSQRRLTLLVPSLLLLAASTTGCDRRLIEGPQRLCAVPVVDTQCPAREPIDTLAAELRAR